MTPYALYNPDDRCVLYIALLEFREFPRILCRQTARENRHNEEDDAIGVTFVLLQPFEVQVRASCRQWEGVFTECMHAPEKVHFLYIQN